MLWQCTNNASVPYDAPLSMGGINGHGPPTCEHNADGQKWWYRTKKIPHNWLYRLLGAPEVGNSCQGTLGLSSCGRWSIPTTTQGVTQCNNAKRKRLVPTKNILFFGSLLKIASIHISEHTHAQTHTHIFSLEMYTQCFHWHMQIVPNALCDSPTERGIANWRHCRAEQRAPGESGALWLHQDWTGVHERRFASHSTALLTLPGWPAVAATGDR